MIAENLSKIKKTIPDSVLLVAVSKTKPLALLEEAYQAGQRHFGENKALEMRDKAEALPKDISWHFIGHLQRNKVKYIIPSVALIHSIDSLRLLQEVNKEAKKKDRKIDCLLQFHIAEEQTKFGFNYQEVKQLLQSADYKELHNVNIVGVMGMATFTENTNQVRREFKELKTIFDKLKENFFTENKDFKHISMGMSNDYLIAIEEGATIVRVGNSIFGKRG